MGPSLRILTHLNEEERRYIKYKTNRTLVETGADVHHQEKLRGLEGSLLLSIASSLLLI